jgi:hypothetical protein
MRSKGIQLLTVLALGASALTLINCGGGDGDSARVAQTVDASKNGVVTTKLADTSNKVHIQGSRQFNLIGTDKDGKETNLNSKASWTLSNPSLGSIKAGLFTAAGKKDALQMVASYAGMSTTLDIELTDANLKSVEVTHPTASVDVCKNTQFTADTIFDDDESYDYPLTWKITSSNPAGIASFADVNSAVLNTTKNGIIKVVASGLDNDKKVISSPEFEFTINSSLTKLALNSNKSLEMRQGQTATVTATGTYKDDSSEDITKNVSLTSSNTGALTVNKTTGVITAVTGSISGTDVNISANCDGTIETLAIKVFKPELQKMEIVGQTNETSTETLSVSVGSSIEPRIKVTYPTANSIDPEIYTGSNAKWEITNTPAGYDDSKVTLNSTTGKITINSSWSLSNSIVVTLSAKLLDSDNNIQLGADGSELKDTLLLTINR